MEPKTQSQGALQPPGRVPPIAIGTATPEPPAATPRRLRRNPFPLGWLTALLPMGLIGAGIDAALRSAIPTNGLWAIVFIGLGVSLLGFGLGLGAARARKRKLGKRRRKGALGMRERPNGGSGTAAA